MDKTLTKYQIVYAGVAVESYTERIGDPKALKRLQRRMAKLQSKYSNMLWLSAMLLDNAR